MKVILVMVATVNGKTTRGDDADIYSWTSKEDADFFSGLIKKHRLIIMGKGTYEAARKKIKPNSKQLRVVLTSNPGKYKRENIPGQLEFHNLPPKKLLEDFVQKGYKNVLLVGGEETNRKFFENGLVDELYLTIEPKLFGKGKTLISDGDFTLKMQLINYKKLNSQGTLLLHYKVKK